MNRTGSLTLDFVAALAWLGVLGLLFVGVGQELRSARRCDDRRGGLETGQNILDGLRHAQAPVLPPGWRVTREHLGGTLILVHAIGPDIELATVLAARPVAAAPAPAPAAQPPAAAPAEGR